MSQVDIQIDADDDVPVFAPPTHKARKTMKVTKGGGPSNTVDVSFRDLTVTVNNRGTKKALLDKVSGYIGAGELLIVLGSSGCGKSTFPFCSERTVQLTFPTQAHCSRRLQTRRIRAWIFKGTFCLTREG